MRWCSAYKTLPGIAVTPRRRKEVIRFTAGNSSSVTIAHASALDFDRLAPFSLVCWAKTTTTAFRMLMTKTQASNSYRGWELSINTTAGKPHFRFDNTLFTNGLSCDFDAIVNDGTWHHIAVTYSGSGVLSGVTGYVDGASKARSLNVDALSATTLTGAPVKLGAHDAVFYTGQLDECAVYNRAITGAEVASLYGAGSVVVYSNIVASGLVGYWRMGEDSFYPNIPDASGNGRDGTMVNLRPGDRINRHA